MAKMKRNIELVSGHVFNKTRLEISIKLRDGQRLWFSCKNRKDFDAIFEFMLIEEELQNERKRKYY